MIKILLVEDNQMNQDMLSRRLLRRGYEVLLADNGQLGVSIALSANPDLILMDMSLPVMDGWEATRLLKGDRRTAVIPVIALTAHAMVGDRDRALAAGCDDYETKPVELARLLQKMDRLLSAPSQLEQSPPESIPEARSTSSQSPNTRSAETQGISSILIVDDNEMNRDMLSRRLERAGYKTVMAQNATEGLEIIEREPISLVVLDVMMPGMSGLEMLQRLRQNYSQAQLPIIMATAKDRSEDMLEAFDLGANDYITKPIDLPVALARIQTHLRTAQALSSPETKFSPNISPIPEPPLVEAAIEPNIDLPIATMLLERYQIRETIGLQPYRSIHLAEDIEDPYHQIYIAENIQLKPEYTNLSEVPLCWRSELEPFPQFGKAAPIARIVASSQLEPEYFLIKERILGESLKDEMYGQKGLLLRKVLGLAIELLEILVCLHEKSMIHQYLQPSSLIRSKSNKRLVLEDLGIFERFNAALARRIDPDSRDVRANLTPYASPEQHQGIILPGCDIYAVGAIVVELLTRLNPAQFPKNAQTGEINWETQVSVGSELTAILNRAIASNPKLRYQSAQQMLDDIYQLPMVAMFRSQGRSLM